MNCKCKAVIKVVSPSAAKVIANNIKTVTLMPKDATAYPEDVLEGKIFYNNEGRQIGTFYNTFLKYNINTIVDDMGHQVLNITDFKEGDINPYYIGLIKTNGRQKLYIINI